MAERRFNPALMSRLQLEAEGIETALLAHIRAMHRDLSNHAAMWQPAPCPSEWGTPTKENQS